MEEISKSLNEFLADLNVFYRKLQNYHWNITGKDFFQIHEKLEEYYNKINEQIDEVAEYILMIGYQPLGTMKDYISTSKIQEGENQKIKDKDVFDNITNDYQTLLQKATCIKEKAENINDYTTSSFIDEYILDYTKIIWMLKQLMQ